MLPGQIMRSLAGGVADVAKDEEIAERGAGEVTRSVGSPVQKPRINRAALLTTQP